MLVLAVLLPLLLLLPPLPGAAQEGWNTSRVLELVDRARAIRQASVTDTTLDAYRARANGYVYFYLDRTDEDDHTLIRADQLAVDVFWEAPGLTRQRIVGRRDDRALPTNIRYHLDHLTVVQDDFSDLIRIGDGDEVRGVVHPVAPGAESVYDYRLADSLSLTYAGLPEPVRVYEVQVQPRDPEREGIIGALYLDRRNGAIVRMAFTFTPASYVDPYLDYIRIALDNALWMERHWLPYRQEVELRRELPQLDFMAGSIIRGRWEVGDYTFNQPIPQLLVDAPRVTAASARAQAAFEFEEGLYADLEERGLGSSEEIDEIRGHVREMALSSALDGLAPVRLHVASFSDFLRRNRAEGLRLGMGLVVRDGERPLRVQGGYALGAERPSLGADFRSDFLGGTLALRAEWNELTDIGPIPGSSGLVNTLASLGERDYLDPFWSSGGRIRWSRSTGAGLRAPLLRLHAGVARHRSATRNLGEATSRFRPVLPVDDGTVWTAGVRTGVDEDGRGTFWSLSAEAFGLDTEWGRLGATVGWSRTGPGQGVEGHLSLAGSYTVGSPAAQGLQLLDGRGTVPGFAYRGTVADQFLLGRSWVRWKVLQPIVSLRATGAFVTSALDTRELPTGWVGETDPGLRYSVGVGVDLLWDVLRLDVARGLPDGDWTLFFSVAPRLTPWL
jgi:hypothetical protein